MKNFKYEFENGKKYLRSTDDMLNWKIGSISYYLELSAAKMNDAFETNELTHWPYFFHELKMSNDTALIVSLYLN